MTKDQLNPYQAPTQECRREPIVESQEDNSLATLALVFFATIIGWVWLAQLMDLLLGGWRSINVVGFLVLVALTIVIGTGLRMSLRLDSKRKSERL